MTQSSQQILEQAIQKAIDGGFKPYGKYTVDANGVIIIDSGWHKFVVGKEVVIYSHDFAKALWGEGHNCNDHIDCDVMHTQRMGWMEHLQQMVIADDPIKYLGEHMNV